MENIKRESFQKIYIYIYIYTNGRFLGMSVSRQGKKHNTIQLQKS